jgi:thioredoxin:protein disulfide reductase
MPERRFGKVPPVKRVAAFCLAFALGAPAVAAAPADPVEPDRAFRPSATLQMGTGSSAQGIEVSYRILSGYYLYRDRIRFEVTPPWLRLLAPEFPPGEERDDPFVGKSRIFRDQVSILLPFGVSPAKPGQYQVRITAQGCAEERLCYAPFVQELMVNIPPGYMVTDAPGPTTPEERFRPR